MPNSGAFGSFDPVLRSDALQEGSVVPFYLSDQKSRIALARIDGHLYAFDDLCTCTDALSCPLSGGMLTGTTIMCQCHGSRFDVVDGAVVAGPATTSLGVYETRELDGMVEVRI
jgi:3-phenylpropionate/trans-cinnamate dioxygenase ferredoxin component